MVEELQLQACMLGGGGRDGQAAAWQVGPELGKVGLWQQVLKESTLISVTGLVEIMRQIHIGAGSTRRPFEFYITGLLLYLLLTTVSGALFRLTETWSLRGERRGAG